MEVFVQNTWITLTSAQVAKIKATEKRLQKCVKSYADVLSHFGLKRVDTSEWENNKGCLWYEHPDRNWCAEIIKHNDQWVEVWAAGIYLKSTGFPGGHIYGSKIELRDAFTEALVKYATEK